MAAPGLLDIFSNDAFSNTSLTSSINTMPFVPGRVGRLGLFQSQGVSTTTIMVEDQAGTLSLIPDTQRGAPSQQNKHSMRSARSFRIPHHPLEDVVLADEIQNVRRFGGTELQGVQDVVNQRLAEMVVKHDATLEYGRMGAIKGIITDADGSSVLYNLFDEFGLTQDTVDFVLGTSTTEIRSKCFAVARLIEDALGADVYSSIHCFAGKTWFERFVAHPTVQKAYANYQEASSRLGADVRTGFTFCGITFEEYRGKVGGISFVADSEAHFFPIGVPGMFISRFAPMNAIDTVNTVGLPRYARQSVDKDFQRFVKLLTESNPINLCRRPKALIKGTTTN
jgi:hypothetical protein